MARFHISSAMALAAMFALFHTATAVLPDRKLPDCQSQTYDNIPDKGKFWFESGAEQYAEEYIIANGDHSNWTRDLYMELFPKTSVHTDCQFRRVVQPSLAYSITCRGMHECGG
jgi:hypothetical protein